MDALAPDPPGWESQRPISLSASLEIDATLGSWRVRLSSSSWWALRERRNQRERRLFKFDRSSSEEVCLKKNLLNPSRFDLKIIRELYREIIGEKRPFYRWDATSSYKSGYSPDRRLDLLAPYSYVAPSDKATINCDRKHPGSRVQARSDWAKPAQNFFFLSQKYPLLEIRLMRRRSRAIKRRPESNRRAIKGEQKVFWGRSEEAEEPDDHLWHSIRTRRTQWYRKKDRVGGWSKYTWKAITTWS